MISRLWSVITCRLLGVRCSIKNPSSKDLIRELDLQTKVAEADASAFRVRRNTMERALRGELKQRTHP